MADLVTIHTWNNASTACTGSVRTRDDLFDLPGNIKKIYKVYLTFTSTVSFAMNACLYKAVDGTETFSNTYVPSTVVSSTTDPNLTVMAFTAYLNVQSLALTLYFTSNNFSIRDMLVEYRPIYKRVS